MTKMLSAAVALVAALALTPAAFGAACADCEPGGGGGGGGGGNSAPTAAFSPSATSPFTLVSVQFTNQSTDDNGVASSLWNFGDGTSSTATSPAHSYSAAGTYTVRLTVTDGGGLTNFVEHQITVVNRAPTAGFTMKGVVQAGEDLALDNISSDMDGSVVGAEWNFGDGSTSTALEPAKSYGTPGTYNVSLKAIDNNGSYSTLTLPVRVNAAPQALILVGTTQTAGQEVQFDSSASDSDGDVTAYEWDFGDGGQGDGPTPAHTYSQPGDYVVNLHIADNDGGVTDVQQSVHVVAPPVENGGGSNGGSANGGGSTTGGGSTSGGSTAGGSTNGGSTTGGSSTQDGAAAGADKSAPALVVPAKLKAKKKAGKLVYTVTTNEAATIVAKLTGKVKGGATIKIAKAGKGKVTIKLSSKAKKALKAAKVVKLSLVTTATDAAGNTTTRTTKVQLV
jgi:PKD repeat protein